MPNWNAFDRKEAELVEAFNRGDIGREEYNKATRELQREMREAHQEEREDAVRRVDDEWGY